MTGMQCRIYPDEVLAFFKFLPFSRIFISHAVCLFKACGLSVLTLNTGHSSTLFGTGMLWLHQLNTVFPSENVGRHMCSSCLLKCHRVHGCKLYCPVRSQKTLCVWRNVVPFTPRPNFLISMTARVNLVDRCIILYELLAGRTLQGYVA